MAKCFLIDGYNLIFQFPELRKRLEYDLEEAREAMLMELSQYANTEDVDLIVVFDGQDKVADLASHGSRLMILFSNPPEKADPLIKRIIEEREDQMNLTIVSSDKEIENYARLHSLNTMTSQKFASLLFENEKSEVEKKFDHTMSSKEMDEWMTLFANKNEKHN